METRSPDAPTGLQEPVGTNLSVDALIEALVALPDADRRNVLLTVVPRIVPRLPDGDIDAFVAELRAVPVRHDKVLPQPSPDAPRLSAAECIEEILRQSLGAQERICREAGARIVAPLDDVQRAGFLDRLRTSTEEGLAGNDLDDERRWKQADTTPTPQP